MQLLLIRHAKAEDRLTWHQDDALRPLTEKGIKQFDQLLKEVLPRIQTPSILISSPYIRAKQTANLMSRHLNIKDIIISDSLACGSPLKDQLKLIQELETQNHKNVCMIGHEPDLGLLASNILTKSNNSFFRL